MTSLSILNLFQEFYSSLNYKDVEKLYENVITEFEEETAELEALETNQSPGKEPPRLRRVSECSSLESVHLSDEEEVGTKKKSARRRKKPGLEEAVRPAKRRVLRFEDEPQPTMPPPEERSQSQASSEGTPVKADEESGVKPAPRERYRSRSQSGRSLTETPERPSTSSSSTMIGEEGEDDGDLLTTMRPPRPPPKERYHKRNEKAESDDEEEERERSFHLRRSSRVHRATPKKVDQEDFYESLLETNRDRKLLVTDR